jgi:FKBP-type peptidyl-prolyl cis-trans isomerase SlyD
MKASKDNVVTIQYTLHVAEELVDQGELDYLHGHSNIVVGLEEALEGKGAGEKVEVAVSPEKGYGIYDPQALQIVSKADFPPGAELEQGAMFYAESAEGQPMPFTILNIEGDDITIDFNHALAGEVLNFNVTVTGVRSANAEELAHGHAHGAHGHNH